MHMHRRCLQITLISFKVAIDISLVQCHSALAYLRGLRRVCGFDMSAKIAGEHVNYESRVAVSCKFHDQGLCSNIPVSQRD